MLLIVIISYPYYTMKRLNLLLSLAALFPGAAMAQAPALPPIVELFSTQACVFCPGADAFFDRLVQEGAITGLGCHVDYFDVERGSLAIPACTARQYAYADNLPGGSIYTPQIIINGKTHLQGDDEDAVRKAIADTAKKPVIPIMIAAGSAPDEFVASLPAIKKSGKGAPEKLTVTVAAYDAPHAVTVSSGANRGKKITYRRVVNAIQDLQDWDGTHGTLKFSWTLKDGQDGFVLMAQSPTRGIVAAGEWVRPPKEAAAPAVKE